MTQRQIRKILEGWEAYTKLLYDRGSSEAMTFVCTKHRKRMLNELLATQLREFDCD